jgi:hypothetical protein
VTSEAFVNDMRGRQLSVGYRSSDDINATMATLERAPQSTRDFLRRTLGE